MLSQENHYAALAPLMALTGVFAHPAASTLLPLILFFIFRWRNLEFAKLVALRAADLAFSMQLYLIVASALLAALVTFYPLTDLQIHRLFTYITVVVLAYMMISLIIATIQSIRGKTFNYVLSLKIGEKVLIAYNKP